MLRKTWWMGLVFVGLASSGGCDAWHERWCEDHNYYRRAPYQGGGCAPGCQPACVPAGTNYAPPVQPTGGCYP